LFWQDIFWRVGPRAAFMGVWRHFHRGSNFWILTLFGSGYAGLGEIRFEAIARGHRVICDQPQTNGGSDSGITPPEFLLVSLGTCAGYYAAQYLKARSLPTDGLSEPKKIKPLSLNVIAKVHQSMLTGEFRFEAGARLRNLKRVYRKPGDMTQGHGVCVPG
jgi:hypothetical protein